MTHTKMTQPQVVRIVIRTAVFVLATSLAGFGSTIGTFDRSFQVSGPVDLEVLTRSGDVTVRNGGAGTVAIHATIHSGISWFGGDHKAEVQELQANPPIRQNGNSIRIDYVNINNISIDYEITVPEDTTLHAHTGSGNQRIEGLKGNVDLGSGSGDMELARLTGELHFETGSGNVRGHELAGPARIKAGSGDIDIEEMGEGDVEVRTGSGNITVNGINGGFHAEAGSGDIRGKGSPKNMWSVRTGSGNVTLNLPSDAAFDVDISSNSGTVTLGHPVSTTLQGRIQESHKSVIGKVRGGGPMVSVHTGSGDVAVD
jgi:Putative adhesin